MVTLAGGFATPLALNLDCRGEPLSICENRQPASLAVT